MVATHCGVSRLTTRKDGISVIRSTHSWLRIGSSLRFTRRYCKQIRRLLKLLKHQRRPPSTSVCVLFSFIVAAWHISLRDELKRKLMARRVAKMILIQDLKKRMIMKIDIIQTILIFYNEFNL